eukprot:SAG31_NODE_558_length_14153_cov_9.068094_16_plen_182_part_00
MTPPHLYSSTHWDSKTTHHYRISKEKCQGDPSKVAQYCEESAATCDGMNSAGCDQYRGCIIKCVLPQMLTQIAAQRGLEVISLPMKDTGVAPDGIHPTCEGHAQIAKVLAQNAFKEQHIKKDIIRKVRKAANESQWKHNNENAAYFLEDWMSDQHTCNSAGHATSCPGPLCGTRGILCFGS